ncbi:unnamed protein product [Linum tenue]|uniref:Uncharacterized protein n=1 Tax=Linum tenue TaxID=586396 RepID=A0AAV0KY80_9ROSI|nr:unnamed protein product [Linum tenue]
MLISILATEDMAGFQSSLKQQDEQVLTSLERLDYVPFALLPGVSEVKVPITLKQCLLVNIVVGEFGSLSLYRGSGALQPLFGMDLKSVLAVAALFE